MTPEENAVLDLLAAAFNEFRKLEPLHPSDVPEFAHAVHNAQNIVLARGALRARANAGQFDPRVV